MIRAHTLLLYHHCCMYTYRRECTTPTKFSLPWATSLPRTGHSPTMSQGSGIGYWGTLIPAAGKQSDVFRKQFEIPTSNLASIWRPNRFRFFRNNLGKREISKFLRKVLGCNDPKQLLTFYVCMFVAREGLLCVYWFICSYY